MTTPAPTAPKDDLREKLACAIYEDEHAHDSSRSQRLWKNGKEENRELYEAKADAVLSVIQPHMEAMDAEIATLKRHWIEDDRDLNRIIDERDLAVQRLSIAREALQTFSLYGTSEIGVFAKDTLAQIDALIPPGEQGAT